MNRPFDVRLPLELAYQRRVLFALELLDAVTLERVSQGVEVVAEGLNGKPIVNAGGLFVWLQEDLAGLQKVSIRPKSLPYEVVNRTRAQLKLPPEPRPLTTIELPPRIDYPFAVGLTGMRGRLVETQGLSPPAVSNAEMWLRWLDEDGAWHDAPTISHTTAAGDFVAILRLAPGETPAHDASGNLTVRLHVRRDGVTERTSSDLELTQGRVTDSKPATSKLATLQPWLFAWDELQP